MTRKQVNMNRNPTGKGGFQDHPELRSDGRWDPKNTFSYQFNKFKNMSVQDFKEWSTKNPEETRSVAEELAYNRVLQAKKNLRDFQEIADRTEGKSVQTTNLNVQEGLSDILDRQETDYAELGQQVKQQILETQQLIQNQEQAGGASDVSTEPDTSETHSGTEQPQAESDTKG